MSEWIKAAMVALTALEADWGEPIADDYEIGRIDDSRGSPSFRIRAGHIRQLASIHAPASAEATGGGVAVPEGWSLVPRVALLWLNGEGQDDNGHHFGEGPDAQKSGAFWWRITLARMLAAAPEPPAAPANQGGSELPMPKYEFQRPHIGSESQPYFPPAAPSPVAGGWQMSPAASDVLAERRRQISVGWTLEHDDEHVNGEMAAAAACYAFTAARSPHYIDHIWPWSLDWFKRKDKRSNLVRAAALLIAEIERLDRAALKPEGA